MSEILQLYSALIVLIPVYMTCWYILSLIFRRNDVADVAWWIGFLLVAWHSLLSTPSGSYSSFIVTVLVSIWSIRLSLHIFLRNLWKGEDYRYKNWRDTWWKWFYIRSFFQIFVLQGFLLLIISLPVVVVHTSKVDFSYIHGFGLCLWGIGFLFESVWDYQLVQFKKNPCNKGQLIRSGLWSLSRHPNYFGEVLQWWSLWVFTWKTPYFFLASIGPLTITILILFVSWIPMLEKKMSLHPDFADYAAKTNKFFPWFSHGFSLLQKRTK